MAISSLKIKKNIEKLEDKEEEENIDGSENFTELFNEVRFKKAMEGLLYKLVG